MNTAIKIKTNFVDRYNEESRNKDNRIKELESLLK